MNTALRSVATIGTALISVMSFDALAASKTLDFTVLRDGSSIGTQSYTIDTNGTDTQVKVSTDIRVKVLFVTLYKFIHESKEVWSNGHLVSLKSTTDDDGTPKSLKATAKNGKIMLNSTINKQNRRQFASAAAIPASLWNPAIVNQATIINTIDGKIMEIKVDDLGIEQVDAKGTKVSARHYKITGELTRDVWYNSQGDLVHVTFPDKSSSKIVYSLN